VLSVSYYSASFQLVLQFSNHFGFHSSVTIAFLLHSASHQLATQHL
jgi:hypothetical protein